MRSTTASRKEHNVNCDGNSLSKDSGDPKVYPSATKVLKDAEKAILCDLEARMARAVAALREMSEVSTDIGEIQRLEARASGVALALSYVTEEIRLRHTTSTDLFREALK